MSAVIPEGRPALALAPMQDITDHAFIKVIEALSGADLYVTEYFRVHQDSRLDPYILKSICENETGKPILAQMIGQDIEALRRSTLELQKYPIAGIDINLGCPAPVVCRKEAGGALLKNLSKLDLILGTLRDLCQEVPFTIKTRIGYDSDEEFENILPLFLKHQPDLLTIHGRTVKNRYQTPVFPKMIKKAVEEIGCPVIANGNVVVFDELKASLSGQDTQGRPQKDLIHYIQRLYEETAASWTVFDPLKHVQKMKKYLNFIVQGLSAEFEHEIRRAKTEEEFFSICQRHLSTDAPIPQFPAETSKLFCGFRDLV